MLTGLLRTLRNALARLTPTLKTVTYSCGRCDLRAKITDRPERVPQLLAIVRDHSCKPKHKTL